MSNLLHVPSVCYSHPPCCLLQEKLTPCYTKMSGATVFCHQQSHDTRSNCKGPVMELEWARAVVTSDSCLSMVATSRSRLSWQGVSQLSTPSKDGMPTVKNLWLWQHCRQQGDHNSSICFECRPKRQHPLLWDTNIPFLSQPLPKDAAPPLLNMK